MADQANRKIALKGRLFLEFKIEALTGIHIGGAFEGVEIGGVDKTVIRNPMDNRPYIPGSSLRGKVRSLMEKYLRKTLNQDVGGAHIHSCEDPEKYENCEVCRVFGLPGERGFGTPARLVVRDLYLSDDSARMLDAANTDLPYSEVKVEVAIDRITSQANPRQLERVPAGAIFDKGEMVFSIYDGEFTFKDKTGGNEPGKLDPVLDVKHFETVLMGLSLLEDDYLGGAGSRGSGRIAFRSLKLGFKPSRGETESYPAEPQWFGDEYDTLKDLRNAWEQVRPEIEARVSH
jgi:CRISPR-associated protein Csm3